MLMMTGEHVKTTTGHEYLGDRMDDMHPHIRNCYTEMNIESYCVN